jgi:hypothetical protein
MNVGDGIPMKGTLCITVRDAVTREIKRRQEIRNKITFLAADVLVELIAQRATDPTPDKGRLYSMRMGTSNTPASRSDINLGAFVVGVQLIDVNKVTTSPGEIQLIAELDSTLGNGNTLREAGLFTAGASPSTSDTPGTTPGTTRMIARQVYADVVKTALVTVDYSWVLSFTASP